MKNIWVIVPAFNEGHALGYLLDRLKNRGVSLLVVDDGSVDNTFAIARERAAQVLRNEKNSGKGMSLKRGITYLLKHQPFEYIITMDADGQHSPEDLDKFISLAAAGELFVVGNRMNDTRGMPKIRVVTNIFMSWLISLLAGQNIADTQCGYRLMHRSVLEKIKMESNKFEMESEILIKAGRAEFNIKSVPIQSIYFKNQKSKINPFIDTLRFIRFLWRLLLRR